MKWLIAPLHWIFKDKRSNWEIRREKKFIDAVNTLKNFTVTERGGLSLNPEDIKDLIATNREALKHLVDPAHRRYAKIASPLNPVQQPSESHHNYFTQIITWRSLPSKAAIRYICLQSMNEVKFAIAATDYVSAEEKHSYSNSIEQRVVQRLKTIECTEPLAWFNSLKEAMDAYDDNA